jgi:hypothetical protein
MCTKDILCVNYRPSDGGIGDFCLAKSEDGWHLFYIYRDFDQPEDCCIPGQEIKLGHALSKNLRNWSWQEPVLHARKGQWDGAHVWAPSIAYSDGMWYMLYTGMGDEIDQKIGLATSKDLWTWAYPKDKPVIDVSGYSWAGYDPGGYSNCRDPYVTCFDHHWLCYCTAMGKSGQSVMGLASSTDLLTWQDAGYVLEKPVFNNEEGGYTSMTESPCVFQRGSFFYLVYNHGYGIRYIISDRYDDFQSRPVHKLIDECYNFEILDVDSGLFAFCNGSCGTGNVYSSLCFGYVSFQEKVMQIVALGNKQKWQIKGN